MAITEIGCMVMAPGVDVTDESTPGGKTLVTAWKKITSQPTGPFRIYWGSEVENPSSLWSFFDFASVEEHQKFRKDFGEDIVKDFDKIFDHGIFTGNKHIVTKPYPPSALRSPVTEIMLAWFPPDISSELKDSNTKRLEQFAEKGLEAIDAHMKFRETDAFKEAVSLIRGLEGLKKLAMFHVKAQIMENETRKP
ncbi:hypothetical protein VSDG_01508 [Cytospora chrysosperma]|uniref:ABM domain-containing protein n=1 Tax=Cytospora chrysosperma TaxID=252740 RepID=A0A423WIN4_CYTCH|nr:hypothetical protein VSDG_01508 [Valsa sordida]